MSGVLTPAIEHVVWRRAAPFCVVYVATHTDNSLHTCPLQGVHVRTHTQYKYSWSFIIFAFRSCISVSQLMTIIGGWLMRFVI